MPNYFGQSAQVESSNTTSETISYTPTAGNSLLLFVCMGSQASQVAQIFDDQGYDVFGNPINSWQNLGSVTQNGVRMELWGCCPVVTAPTKTTILVTNMVATLSVHMLEYEGVASFSSYGTANNTGYSDLFFNGTAENNTNMMVVGFVSNTGMSSGNGVVPPQNIQIVPGVNRIAGDPFTIGQLMVVEQAVITSDELITVQAVTGGSSSPTGDIIPSSGLMAVGVVLNGGLVINPLISVGPGFADIEVNELMAGTPGTLNPTNAFHAATVSQIAANAALGMARPEFFYSTVIDGDTVPSPISPIDGYVYQRDELLYIYTPISTFDVSLSKSEGPLGSGDGWASGSGLLFYGQWDVDPNTGVVAIQEVYHPDGNVPTDATHDGQLLVLVVAQRVSSNSIVSTAISGLTMADMPNLYSIPTSDAAQDVPVTQSLARTLADSSKFCAVKAEVFFCGEFVDGERVLPPKSPVDGYQYSLSEVMFISSWMWNTSQAGYQPPPSASVSGASTDGGWSQLQRMEANVSATGLVHCQVFFYNHNEIDPTAPANGGLAYGRVRVFAFCQRAQGPAISVPYLDTDTGSATVTAIMQVKGSQLSGTVSGALTVSIPAAIGHGLTVGNVVIKKCASGSTTVLSSTTLSTGAALAAGESLVTPATAYSFDQAHDYYVYAYLSGYTRYLYNGTQAAVPASSPLLVWSFLSGDHTGDSTISVTAGNPFGISGIALSLTGDTTPSGYTDIPISAIVPGSVLTNQTMSGIMNNVKLGSRAIEFFGVANHVQGDTVSLPTSPIDGYSYKRQELMYIWQWRTTGQPAIRLFGWGATIDQNGLVNMMSWHVQNGGPIANNTSGSSIDVITIGVRSSVTDATKNPLSATNGTPPSDLSMLVVGGVGGYTVNGGS